MRTRFLASALLALACGTTVTADEAIATARPVPLTRDEMKRMLEELKSRQIRIPLPELTAADREALGERAESYEARLRYHYLPANEGSVFGFRPQAPSQPGAPPPPQRDFTRNADENMTLSYSFKTMLFWIVARTNNCQYCLGHQEQKLSAVGMSEAEIAALDFDWKKFKPAEQAAFAYARKITYSPHQIGDADIEALRKYYTDSQILEMTLSTAGNNAINRWKEGAGIPQSKDGSMFFRRGGAEPPKDRPIPNETFLTPTAPEYSKSVSQVVPVIVDITGTSPAKASSSRPALESRADAEAALAAARTRQSRLPLKSDEDVRQAWGTEVPEAPVPNWMKLMATFPNEGKNRLSSLLAMTAERGDLSLKTKAQVSWIIARLDRAWYAAGQAQAQLKKLGQTDDQIFALDGDWHEFSAEERALFQFARNLAMSPIALTDEDVANALDTAGPRKVVQLVNFVTSRAYFDRVTEAAGLPIETP